MKNGALKAPFFILLFQAFFETVFQHIQQAFFNNVDSNSEITVGNFMMCISKIFKIGNTDKFQLNLTEGIGAGFIYPKTKAMLLGKERHDDFHISGYGVSAKVGLNFTFFKYFFIQTELKGGYIDMHDIKTTFSNADKASQHFFFLQRIIAFGGIFRV